MPSLLVVEDGNIVAGANCYHDVAYADTYWASHGSPSAWSSSSTAQKETAIILAAQYLDIAYSNRWVQRRINLSQTMEWPRFFVMDRDGFPIPPNSVPTKIKQASCELALRQRQGDTLVADVLAGTNIQSESVSVGPISTSKTYAGGGKGQIKKYRLIDLMVSEFLSGGISGGRIYRA